VDGLIVTSRPYLSPPAQTFTRYGWASWTPATTRCRRSCGQSAVGSPTSRSTRLKLGCPSSSGCWLTDGSTLGWGARRWPHLGVASELFRLDPAERAGPRRPPFRCVHGRAGRHSSLSRRDADKDGWPTRSTLRSIPRRLPRDHREGRLPQVIPHGNACKHATRGS
jgi:hypothetical protein